MNRPPRWGRGLAGKILNHCLPQGAAPSYDVKHFSLNLLVAIKPHLLEAHVRSEIHEAFHFKHMIK